MLNIHIIHAYHRWVVVFRKSQSDCRVSEFLLKDRAKSSAKEITGHQILRKFTEYIKRPIIRVAAEVIKHLDMTNGGKPRSDQTWMDVLKIMKEWWRTQELTRKELDKRRRAVKTHNRSESVVGGTTSPQKIPDVLPTT